MHGASIINITIGTKNPHMGFKIVIIVKYCRLVGRGRVCHRIFVYPTFFLLNTTLNHIEGSITLPRFEDFLHGIYT
jgi:hypothetical protein